MTMTQTTSRRTLRTTIPSSRPRTSFASPHERGRRVRRPAADRADHRRPGHRGPHRLPDELRSKALRMERLSPLDASFLYLEGPRTPMHISSLAVYEGPPPPDDELHAMLERRLPLVPRFRQRLGDGAVRLPPSGVDRRRGLRPRRAPAARRARRAGPRTRSCSSCGTHPVAAAVPDASAVGDVADHRPRARRFAVLSKTHHCLWDGISGVDLHAVLLDDSPDDRADEPPAEPFDPEARAERLRHARRRAPRSDPRSHRHGAQRVIDAARDPAATLRERTDGSRATRRASRRRCSSRRRASPLNGTIGSRRRFAIGRGSLHEAKDLKHTLGASVNDVVLAAVAGAIRQWQIHRAHRAARRPRDGARRRVRGEPRRPSGNRVAMVVVDLPVTDRTALMRLDRVHSAMERAKTSGHVAGGDAITRLSGFLPPAGDRRDDEGAGDDASVQPRRDEHPRPPAAAVPARTQAPRALPAGAARGATRDSRSLRCPTTASSASACSPTTTACTTST